MKKICAAFLAVLMLCGCGKPAPAKETTPTEPEVIATTAPDGNPEDETCKGSYTGEGNGQAIVAKVGSQTLSNEELAVWYWAKAAQYRQEDHPQAPDFSLPLDTQVCTVDDTVASWQQYFLKTALEAWHTAAALNEQSLNLPLKTEDAYKPNLENYKMFMSGKPAAKFLYGYEPLYSPNSMHQEYLDSIPETLAALAGSAGYADALQLAEKAFGASAQVLEKVAHDLNRSYMYFTQLTYDIPEDSVEEEPTGEYLVNFRHIFLSVEDEEPEKVLYNFRETERKRTRNLTKKDREGENMFADMAHYYSEDTMSALDGGKYLRVAKEELPAQIDAWCFDPERKSGDKTEIIDETGIHLLYFSGKESVEGIQAQEQEKAAAEQEIIRNAKKAYPMEVVYPDIVIPEASAEISVSDLLYPDIAHERYPEIPLYLQQDYPNVMYGSFRLSTNGCGITSMAMLASYMADEYLSPPEMCRRFGSYSHHNGTDGMIFVKEPSGMDFYFLERAYEPQDAWKRLEEGYTVISVQRKGYWTRGGHYIVLEKITDSGKVQVRDSNIANYKRLPQSVYDEHTWENITASSFGYWVFDNKIKTIPGCVRCGDPQNTTGGLVADYYCRKCAPAELRRDVYLRGV